MREGMSGRGAPPGYGVRGLVSALESGDLSPLTSNCSLCPQSAFEITNCDLKERVPSKSLEALATFVTFQNRVFHLLCATVNPSSLIPVERIERAIYLIRGEKVMLDRDLAALYEVETRVLNQAVGRNSERFPPDFMFELTREEILGISQIVTSSNLRFSKRVTAYTEQGVAMLSTVLRSKRAISVNIEIMRAFVKMRQMLASNAELSHRFDELERKYDRQFKVVFDAIRRLMSPPVPSRKQIGFRFKNET